MSKIVCDICGTTYDDSTGPCPVCGWNPGATLDPSSENIDDIMSDDYQLDEEEPEAAQFRRERRDNSLVEALGREALPIRRIEALAEALQHLDRNRRRRAFRLRLLDRTRARLPRNA